jgi:hypothetical protein
MTRRESAQARIQARDAVAHHSLVLQLPRTAAIDASPQPTMVPHYHPDAASSPTLCRKRFNAFAITPRLFRLQKVPLANTPGCPRNAGSQRQCRPKTQAQQQPLAGTSLELATQPAPPPHIPNATTLAYPRAPSLRPRARLNTRFHRWD